MKHVLVGDAQFLTPTDYIRIGLYPIEAAQDLAGDVIGYPAHWAAFTVSEKSNQRVEVSPGRYYDGRLVYAADEVQEINLQTFQPIAASDEKWVALILRGEIEEDSEQRAFDTSTDPETQLPVPAQTPVVRRYAAEIVIQQGAATPAPAVKPAIAETDACIAFVRLKSSGIQEIAPGEAWRAKSLFEVEGRVTAIELRVAQLFQDTETIRTDLGNVAADVVALRNAIPNPGVFQQIVRDTARHAQVLNLPEEARNYHFDQALVKDFWDFQQGGYFRIDEGIRFQYSAQRDHLLRLQAYDDPAVSVWDNRLVMPAYSEVVRISSPEGTARKDIANIVHTITTASEKTLSHEKIRYGETVTKCENVAGWYDVGDRKAGEIFKANGEEWIARGVSDSPYNDLPVASQGHMHYDAQKVIRDTWTTSYVEYNTYQVGLSGAIHGQTFLCSQVMVATSIDLYFTGVGATGDVLLCLCEIDGSGAPNFDGILAKVNKGRNDLVFGWNKFRFQPTLLDQGRRYAWFVMTSGNHQLMANTGNAFNGGTLFLSTDGAWSQGATTEDFTFRLNAARFKSSRVVVPMESLTLEGGMTEITMVYKAWAPAATKLAWEVRVPGVDAQWVLMDDRVDNPLANLPPLVQLRAIMVGTEDVAPAIDLDQWARVIAGRMRLDMRAITKLLQFGFGTDEASIVLNMDAYDAARHTVAPKIILANGTVVNPLSVVATVDPSKASRTKFVANFDLPAGTTQARARVDATTNSVIHVPFGQDIQLNAF